MAATTRSSVNFLVCCHRIPDCPMSVPDPHPAPGRSAPRLRRPQVESVDNRQDDLLDLLATTARARLRLLAVLGLTGFLILALLALAVPIAVGTPLRSAGILGGLSLALALISGAVWWLAAQATASSRGAISLGLAYAWMCGQAMAATEIALAPTSGIYNGVPGLCVWIVFFPTIIPCLPRQAFNTGLAIALALPLDYIIARMFGLPEVSGQALVGWFVPPLFCAALAGTAALLANRLTVQLAEARRAVRDLGAYALERRLDHGGMGEVWLARHRLLPRAAAVKFLKLSAEAGPDPQRNARFEREASAIALLQSPHTIQIYDFGLSEDGELYFAMELLDGLDLAALITGFGRQKEARVAAILAQICLSLMEAHAQGLIHRDLSPRNVMLCRLGAEVDHVKVLDFGLVGVANIAPNPGDAKTSPPKTSPLNSSTARIRASGPITTLVGTPGYIAPEVVNGGTADARSDLYALGCLGYWMLTATTLHPDAESGSEDLEAHVRLNAQPPSARINQELHIGLEEIILTCLARNPQQRPASAADLRAQLLRLHFPDAWSEGRARRWWAEHQPG